MWPQIHKMICELIAFITPTIEGLSVELQPVKSILTVINIDSTKSPQKMARKNPNRSEIWLHNSSDKDFLFGPVSDIHAQKYSSRLAPNDTIILSAHNFAQMYKGEIYGFWETGASSQSKLMITEYSA